MAAASAEASRLRKTADKTNGQPLRAALRLTVAGERYFFFFAVFFAGFFFVAAFFVFFFAAMFPPESGRMSTTNKLYGQPLTQSI